jgi:imidazolonepropionase-like amidohydrolase
MMTPKSLAVAAAILCGVALSAVARAQEASPDAYVVYRGATLVDGTGATRPGMSILVHGERIDRVAKTGEIAAPAGARMVDVVGLYAAPGLINSHEHLATPPNRPLAEARMKKDLYGGITAVRDMADDLRQVGDLARVSRIGQIPGPDIYYAALMAGPAFFHDPRVLEESRGVTPGTAPWMRAVTPATDLEIAVAEARGTGARGIKIYADLDGREVAAITKEAHRQGERVWAHAAVFPASPLQVVDAGVDTVSHVCMIAYQASDVMPTAYHDRAPVDAARVEDGRNPAVEGVLRDMKRRGTILDVTLSIIERVWAEYDAHPVGPAPYCTPGLDARLAAEAYRDGVLISTGTDDFSEPSDPWPALQGEFDLLQNKASMKPVDVLRAATLIGAMALGEADEMGALDPGKLANIVFTRRDPLADVSAFRTVVLTVKRGVPYWRRDYEAAWKPARAKSS